MSKSFDETNRGGVQRSANENRRFEGTAGVSFEVNDTHGNPIQSIRFGNKADGYEIVGATTQGPIREQDEDYLSVVDGAPDTDSPAGYILAVLCDGAGGGEMGEEASRYATQQFISHCQTNFARGMTVEAAMRNAVRTLDNEFKAWSGHGAQHQHAPATTLTACFLDKATGQYTALNIGDADFGTVNSQHRYTRLSQRQEVTRDGPLKGQLVNSINADPMLHVKFESDLQQAQQSFFDGRPEIFHRGTLGLHESLVLVDDGAMHAEQRFGQLVADARGRDGPYTAAYALAEAGNVTSYQYRNDEGKLQTAPGGGDNTSAIVITRLPQGARKQEIESIAPNPPQQSRKLNRHEEHGSNLKIFDSARTLAEFHRGLEIYSATHPEQAYDLYLWEQYVFNTKIIPDPTELARLAKMTVPNLGKVGEALLRVHARDNQARASGWKRGLRIFANAQLTKAEKGIVYSWLEEALQAGAEFKTDATGTSRVYSPQELRNYVTVALGDAAMVENGTWSDKWLRYLPREVGEFCKQYPEPNQQTKTALAKMIVSLLPDRQAFGLRTAVARCAGLSRAG